MTARIAGAVVATVCGIATAYTTFAPELQKQQAEKFAKEHGSTIQTNSEEQKSIEEKIGAVPAQQTIISNEETLGKDVKEALSEVKSKTESGTSWPGLSLFKWSFGGARSPEADDVNSHVGREGPSK